MESTKKSVGTELSVDVCVIGGAGSGLSAAVRAREAGAKKVVVLEKMKILGGCTRLAGGMFSVESPAQKRLGIHNTADDCFIHHMDMSNWNCDAKLVRDWMCRTSDAVRWLEDKGCLFPKVVSFAGAAGKFYHMTESATGNTIVITLLKACEEKGVELLVNTRATKLITDRDGNVTGVLATQGDKEIKISAKSVVIATGSISNNKELLARFYPNTDLSNVKIMAALTHNTGDGLIMAEEAGAATTDISTFFIGPHNHPHNVRTGLLIRRPHLIKLNKAGERFVDEALTATRDWGWMLCMTLDRQPDRTCYALMSENIFRTMLANKKNYNALEVLQGTKKDKDILAVYGKEDGDNLSQDAPTAWLNKLENDIRSEEKAGRVKIANTLDEIAEWIGVKPEVLKTTVADYNTYCQNQYDADFLKDPEYLLPLTTPPYYAFEAHQGIDTCIGGIRINHRLEVLNKNFKPIKGLYAVGVAAGGWLSHGYGFFGSEMSFTIYSGYAVGKIAAEYANSKA